MNIKFLKDWATNAKLLHNHHTVRRPRTSIDSLNHLLSTLEYSYQVTKLPANYVTYTIRRICTRRLITSILRITDEDNIYAWWTLADSAMPAVLLDTEEPRFIKEHQDYALALCTTNPFEATLFTLVHYNVIDNDQALRLLNVFKAEDALMGAEPLLNPEKSEHFLAEARNRFILNQYK